MIQEIAESKMKLKSANVLVSIIIAIAIGVSGADYRRGQSNQPQPLRINAKLADITAQLERDIPPMMSEASVPGVSIALVKDGEVAWQHAFGVKDAKTKEPVTDNTVFEAASLSKPVFAYAVLKLVDSGKFDLDKPLNQYLPGDYDVGPDPRLGQITARRVLSTQPGFRTGEIAP